ncbi:acyl-CoA/acyl-ACP dehydrogenase [Rhodococcus pseudokoreensis]|uniref:Acyl-CoA/acyl-ACP dehydrogenase n=1 Tax=Rhodococcus pseudokoreensis TaxID=2811421 RepID=A0A974W0N7_9NOCA|nr:acyl-CoA dehydrogenase family protein [Rhodococcus pseudokoreensis]QSE88203.1 acyl-CoA/acyl-ACP dehydrogenase [Rhodococcus pseudokoreensis]
MTQEFEFSDELVELRTMVRDFCREFSPEAVVREAMESDTGHDPALWRRFGSELGVLGLAVPEAYGGDDAGLVAQAVAVEEMGVALVCGPVLGTVALAMPALAALTDEDAKRELLPELCSGAKLATLVAPLSDGTLDVDAVTVTATTADGAWRLGGEVTQAPDAGTADLLLVVATTDEGPALFAVAGDAAGLTRTPLTTLDLTRRQAALSFAGTPARLLATGAEALGACARAALVAGVLLAVEQVGGAQRMLDITVAHVANRKQFGQAVGAYQAVKHRCANMLIAVETARSAAYHGVWALQDGTDDPQLAASLAKAVASESYAWVSTSAIQMHGGLGFTWEGTPQLYFKRATTDSLTLGTADQHLDRIAGHVLDGLVRA